jgi:hypothetical protein
MNNLRRPKRHVKRFVALRVAFGLEMLGAAIRNFQERD